MRPGTAALPLGPMMPMARAASARFAESLSSICLIHAESFFPSCIGSSSAKAGAASRTSHTIRIPWRMDVSPCKGSRRRSLGTFPAAWRRCAYRIPPRRGCHGLAPWCFTFVATERGRKEVVSASCVATNLTNHGASPWDWDATGLSRGPSRSWLLVATNLTNHGASPWDWDATGLSRGPSRSLLLAKEEEVFLFSPLV